MLAKDTSYWVVAEGGSGTWYTGAGGYTALAPGFSIADYRESRGKDATGSFDQTMGAAWQIMALGFININAGAPAITAPNVFRVPAVLGVDLSGITDPEGTTNIADNATYKWQRFDATGDTLETDSIGTSSTYTLTDADAGKTLKVVVNFTDDANNSEGPLTSAATPVITAAASCNAPTLTGGATFLGAARKLGVGAFSLRGAFYGFTGAQDATGNAGSLDSATFTTAANNTYQIVLVATVGSGVWVILDSALSADDQRTVVLHVCDEAVAFGSVEGGSSLYILPTNPAHTWLSHAERTIYLSQDTAAPTLDSATTVDRRTLALTFSEDLGAAASLANAAFTVKKTRNAAQTTLTLDHRAPPSISGRTVTLTLGGAAVLKEADTNVLVSYTSPMSGTANKLVDKFGNEAAFTDEVVTNTITNTAPTSYNRSVTMEEDGANVFAAADFPTPIPTTTRWRA